MDDGVVVAVWLYRHPVADRGEPAVLLSLVAESAGKLGCELGFAVVHEIEQFLLTENAPGAKPVGFVRGESAGEEISPAEVGEVGISVHHGREAIFSVREVK